MPAALESFDRLPLKAFAFACTGSAYLLGTEREKEITNGLAKRHQIPMISATRAIQSELNIRQATRLAMLAPYPPALCAVAEAYWRQVGFEILASKRIEIGTDTRAIYSITDEQVLDALHDFDSKGADVILASGTGMPTISSLLAVDTPVVSSNLCLATEILRKIQLWGDDEPAEAGLLRNN